MGEPFLPRPGQLCSKQRVKEVAENRAELPCRDGRLVCDSRFRGVLRPHPSLAWELRGKPHVLR